MRSNSRDRDIKRARSARLKRGRTAGPHLAAIRLARASGVFGEPAGVTAIAGVIKMKEAGDLDGAERVVALVTGHGLKDIDSALKAAQGAPIMVEPDIEDIAAKLAI